MYSITRLFVFVLTVAGLGFACYGFIVWSKDAPRKSKPHIVFIVADDMGWNDVSFHGSNQIPTPNIDALAYNGVILNRHYVLPLCTPSRSSLLTGRYAIREGMQGFPLGSGFPEGLPLDRTLMPEYFKRLGYSTHLVGKWHVGYYTKDHTPSRRGFDTFYGYYNGFISYFGHWYGQAIEPVNPSSEIVIGRDFHRDTAEHMKILRNETAYFTDIITDEATKIIRNHGEVNDERPLFIKISHLAVHAGDMTVDTQEVRNTEVNDKIFSHIKDERRRRYAGMMKALDESVGEVIKSLGETGMLQNSIVVFMADNGAPTIGQFSNAGSNYPLRGIKDTTYEGAVRGAACIFSPLIKSRARVSEQTIHIADWLPTLYHAAGGNLTDLQDIDGLNQWPTILDDDVTSPRVSTLVNIDDIRGGEAALIGRYKLVRGAKSSCENCYGESGDESTDPEYRPEEVLSSPAGLAISRLDSYYHQVSEVEVEQLREKSTVRCKPSTVSTMNCTKSCLFDVVEDPCETRDIKDDHPEVLKALAELIEEYRKVMKPQDRKPFDFCGHPRNFNDTWMPWISDDSLPPSISGKCQKVHFD